MPNQWVFITISTVFEKGEFSTDSYWYYDEFIQFEVTVGCWYDNIHLRNKDAEDYMRTVYSYDPSKNKFSYRIRIGSSTNCRMPRADVKKKFFACLDDYEKNNPNRKLTRTSYGIHHLWNL